MKALDAIFDFLAGRAMTVVLMFVAAAAMAVITIFEAREGSEGIVFRYYYSSWFLTLLTLVWLNLLANMLKPSWWRFKRMHLSLTHLGFLLILTGGAMTWTFGLRGDLSIMEGETRDTFRTQDPVLTLTSNDGTGASFVIKDHDSLKGGSFFRRINPFAPKNQAVVGGRAVILVDAMASSRVATDVVEAEEGPAAVVLDLEARGKEQVVLMDGENVELMHPALSRIVYRHLPEGTPDFDLFDESIEIKPPSGPSIKVTIKTPEDVGRIIEKEGYQVEIVEYHPDFKMGKEPDYDAPPRNPALRLDVKGPAASGMIYTFSLLEFHGNTLEDGTKVLYHRPATGPTVLVVSRSADRLEVYDIADKEPVELSQSAPFVCGEEPMQLTITPVAFLPASREEEKVSVDRTGRGPAAYQIRVGDGEPVWLTDGKGEATSGDGGLRAEVDNAYPLGFAVTLDDAVAEYWPVSNIPKAYYSMVRISSSDTMRIETNAPLFRNGFRLYQSGMDQEPPYRHSIFSVSRDPGVIPVTLGFLIMSAGLLWLYCKRFIMKPIRLRRQG